jgi:hypothetical protein
MRLTPVILATQDREISIVVQYRPGEKVRETALQQKS